MNGIIHFETFLITGILLNLTPGNDTIFILTRSISYGTRAGVISALGIGTGSIIHTTLAAFGLSVIIAKSIFAFTILKYAGTAYLVFLGLKMIFGKSALNFETAKSVKTSKLFGVYRDAVLTNVLNPKVAMFYIAFLPQFIDPNYAHDAIPFLILGISFTITGTIWCLALAIFSSRIFSKLREKPAFSNVMNKSCGIVLIALGLKLALTQRK